MNTALKHTRSALAVLGAFAIATAIGLAVETGVRAAVIHFHPDGSTLADNFSWMVRQWFYMFPVLLIGFVITKVARFHPPAYLVAMICIQGLVIVRAEMFPPAQSVPPWLWIMTMIVTPLPIILVGWLQIQPPSRLDTSTDGLPTASPTVG